MIIHQLESLAVFIVDGKEILYQFHVVDIHRVFIHPRWCRISSINSIETGQNNFSDWSKSLILCFPTKKRPHDT